MAAIIKDRSQLTTHELNKVHNAISKCPKYTNSQIANRIRISRDGVRMRVSAQVIAGERKTRPETKTDDADSPKAAQPHTTDPEMVLTPEEATREVSVSDQILEWLAANDLHPTEKTPGTCWAAEYVRKRLGLTKKNMELAMKSKHVVDHAETVREHIFLCHDTQVIDDIRNQKARTFAKVGA